jgi:hypothetical protein
MNFINEIINTLEISSPKISFLKCEFKQSNSIIHTMNVEELSITNSIIKSVKIISQLINKGNVKKLNFFKNEINLPNFKLLVDVFQNSKLIEMRIETDRLDLLYSKLPKTLTKLEIFVVNTYTLPNLIKLYPIHLNELKIFTKDDSYLDIMCVLDSIIRYGKIKNIFYPSLMESHFNKILSIDNINPYLESINNYSFNDKKGKAVITSILLNNDFLRPKLIQLLVSFLFD